MALHKYVQNTGRGHRRLESEEGKMTRVILKTGKVLIYNRGEHITEEEQSYVVCLRDRQGLIARIPVANVERIEFEKPCKIGREMPLRKIRRYE